MQEQPRILVMAGSIRSGAFSAATADAAQMELVGLGAEVTRISLADYPMPIYDQDLEESEGVPENALKLARHFASHDGLLVASPEYNASIPPILKNALDWVSRARKDGDAALRPYAGLTAALCSSSNGAYAGMRGLYHLRAVLMACGAEVLTPQASVSRAAEAFGEDGRLRDERARATLERVCAELAARLRAAPRR